MPGNYELYDPSTNKLGPVICKVCWERFKKENSGPMNTVWVSYEGRQMYWWLCDTCTETLKAEGYGLARFLKSSEGVVLSPRFDV
jgi:hypothetical protein